MYLKEIELGKKLLEGERIGHILSESEDYSLRRIGDRMVECSKHLRVYKRKNTDGTSDFQIRTLKCGKRGCLVCDRVKCSKHIKKIMDCFDQYGLDNIKFVTCTFPKRISVYELREAMDLMSEALGKLFRKKSMRFVTGGFKAMEAVDRREETFNPHAHMLIHHEGKDLRSDKNIQRFLKSEIFQETFEEYLKNQNRHFSYGIEKLKEKIDWFLERGLLHQVVWSALFKSVGLGAICYVEPVNKKSAYEVAKYFTKTWEVSDNVIEELFKA